MYSRLTSTRRAILMGFSILAMAVLASCVASVPSGSNTGQRINAGEPVEVALLVPGGSLSEADNFLATNLENAARLAIADLNGVAIDLRVYNTSADAETAAQAARQAANDGAKIILGPLYAEAANAAGVAVAARNVNVLAFSNNTSIAGGNVFILGQTFLNTANRLVRFATATGSSNYMILHGDDLQGAFGRDAIETAIRRNGATISSIESYPLSQQAIVDRAPEIADAAELTFTDTVFMTAGVNADLPIVATVLPERGLSSETVRYIGLTRWDAAPQLLALPALQNGLFAVPDAQMSALFEARYAATFGATPHPLAGLAYDGIAAIGALVATGKSDALTASSLTQAQGFQGTSGIFRFLPDGSNERGLAVATVENNQVVILDPAPRSFGRAGF